MKALVFAVTLAASGGSAMAQDAGRHDLFAGYSMLAAEGTLHGGQLALGWGLTERIALAVDLGVHQGTSDVGDDVNVLSLLAGPRVAFGSGRPRLFVHAMGGVVRSRAGVGIFEVDITRSSTGLGGAAGGGLDFALRGRWGLRAAADYRLSRLDGETEGDPRFSAGIVYRFGTE